MPKAFNLVLELGDTNIPHDPCKLPCIDKHFIVVRPGEYDKRKKLLKKGALFVGFTVKGKTKKAELDEIIKDAKRYQFNNGK